MEHRLVTKKRKTLQKPHPIQPSTRRGHMDKTGLVLIVSAMTRYHIDPVHLEMDPNIQS